MRRRALVLVGLLAIAILGISIHRGLQLRPRLDAVPAELIMRAEVPGMPGVRYWVSLEVEPFVRDVLAAREREAKPRGLAGSEQTLPEVAVLALSGGGDKGAFGAGLLCGWTDSGKRPQFKAVTGISTGALIAPFAFLGPEYDHVLRTVYTTLGPKDVARKRSLLAAITDDGMADNRPLWDLISRFVDEGMMRRIAEEHAKGRILLIGTTDLDAMQAIIWNVGKIAASGNPGALDLMRKILIASAAIPGAFPPTMIRVEVDGKLYEEMHVDGGASAQVFLYPPRMRTVAARLGEDMSRRVRVYVIRNSFLRPEPVRIERRTLDIAQPAISSLIHTQGLGDLLRIYLTTKQDGLDFNLAYIGDDFKFEHRTDFDTAFMKALFDYAYGQAAAGYPWHELPPQLEHTVWRADPADLVRSTGADDIRPNDVKGRVAP